MISLRPESALDNLSSSAGKVIVSLSVDPLPCTIPIDGSTVSSTIFPELYNVLPKKQLVGTTGFKLTPIGGRFFKAGVPWTLVSDKMKNHIHENVSIASASHPSHSYTKDIANGGSSWLWGSEDSSAAYGVRSGKSVSSSSSGGHSHEVIFGGVIKPTGADASVFVGPGDYSAPANTPLPHYMHVGRDSDSCVLIVAGENFVKSPEINTIIPNLVAVCGEFAKKNIHAYKYSYPAATDSTPSFPAAHLNLVVRINELRSKYKKVYVLGAGAGANIAALAVSLTPTKVSKFVGLYGIYDLASMPETYKTNYLAKYLGGLTSELLSAASPRQLNIPVKLWHANNDTVVPKQQSLNWAPTSTTLIATGGNLFNPITVNVMNDILTWVMS